MHTILNSHAFLSGSCTDVKCGVGKTCVMRSGKPKCICSPNCKRHDGLRVKGPVCGTDGVSYKSHCRLKKRSCRTRDQSLVIAYHGLCQSEYWSRCRANTWLNNVLQILMTSNSVVFSYIVFSEKKKSFNCFFFTIFSVCLCPIDSCDKVTCPGGKYCLQDQNLMPHCVKCATYCPPGMTPSKLVCGSDGRTYQSACHLREAACRVGKAIPIAYKGRCKSKCTWEHDHLSFIEFIILLHHFA